MTPQELFELARPITKPYAKLNKYTHFAYHNNLKNYRLLSSGEVLMSGKLQELPERIKRVLSENMQVLVIANVIEDKIPLVYIRSLNSKEFVHYGYSKGIPYGIGQFNPNFKYGDPIILCEGQLDSDVIRQFYPNVIALQTANMSLLVSAVVKALTNNIALLLDNDDAGNKSADKIAKFNKDLTVTKLKQYPGYKDPGDLAEHLYFGSFDTELAEQHYKAQISHVLNSVDFN